MRVLAHALFWTETFRTTTVGNKTSGSKGIIIITTEVERAVKVAGRAPCVKVLFSAVYLICCSHTPVRERCEMIRPRCRLQQDEGLLLRCQIVLEFRMSRFQSRPPRNAALGSSDRDSADRVRHRKGKDPKPTHQPASSATSSARRRHFNNN